jgi:mono/diheme cytochrome c family protein
VLLPLLLICACGTDAGDDETGDDDASSEIVIEDASLCAVQAQVFTPVCYQCHNSVGLSGGLDLSEGNAFSNTLNVPAIELASMDRVEPGDPEHSYLWRKLEGTHVDAGGSGNKMPLSGTITDEQKALVKAWIEAGATSSCESAARVPAGSAR